MTCWTDGARALDGRFPGNGLLVRVRRKLGQLVGCWTILAITAIGVNAQVAAQAVQSFETGPVSQTPIQASGSVTPAPIQAAGSVTAEPIQPSGSVGPSPLRVPGPENPAIEAELTKLRAAATRQARRGSALGKSAAQASWVMGLLYLHGKGVAKDPAQAQIWFERAWSLGAPLASAGLAWCEIEGCGTAPNPASARRWISQIRQVDVPRSEYLEWLMESRLAPLQIASPMLREPKPLNIHNHDLLVRAANEGDIHARIELGLESVAANRLAEAMAYFRAAAPRSEAAAANVALLLEHMRTGPDNGAKAAPGPQGTAATADQLLASARRYHRGEGVPANYVEAIRLYRLAEAKGSLEAHRMLALIASRPTADGQIDVVWMQQLSNIDLSRDTPQLDNASTIRLLSREPTALYDLLPAKWRNESSHLIR